MNTSLERVIAAVAAILISVCTVGIVFLAMNMLFKWVHSIDRDTSSMLIVLFAIFPTVAIAIRVYRARRPK